MRSLDSAHAPFLEINGKAVCKMFNLICSNVRKGGATYLKRHGEVATVKRGRTTVRHLEKASDWQPNRYDIRTPPREAFFLENVNRAEHAFCASTTKSSSQSEGKKWGLYTCRVLSCVKRANP